MQVQDKIVGTACTVRKVAENFQKHLLKLTEVQFLRYLLANFEVKKNVYTFVSAFIYIS